MIRRWSDPRMGFVLSAAILGVNGGCGSSAATSSTEEATVHGTVKLKGKFVTSGTVFFDPSNINRKNMAALTAKISPDGRYTIKTLVGSNKVMVSSPETVKDPVLQYNMVQHKVVAGENTYDIEVMPP